MWQMLFSKRFVDSIQKMLTRQEDEKRVLRYEHVTLSERGAFPLREILSHEALAMGSTDTRKKNM